MIRILHLSDFHLNQKTLKDWKQYLRDALIENISILEDESRLTFIAFTGDLIDLGGSDFKDIDTAFATFKTEVIVPIIKHTRMSIDKFLIVPGNHDILRNSDNKRSELGSQIYFKQDYGNISEYILNAIKENDFQGMERIKPFKRFEKELYHEVINYHHTIFGSSFKFKTETEDIGICCLNSSWRCYDKNDAERLIIGEDQLIENLNYIKDCKIKIALMHHPLDWLIESERGFISNHLSKDFDLLLMGHVHQNKTSLVTGFTGTLFKNIAVSGLNDIRSDSKTFSNGFTIIDFNKIKNEIKCQYWRYNHDQKSFVLNNDLTKDGTSTFFIPSQKSKKNDVLNTTLIENICEDHFCEMNEHLMGTKANSSKLCIKEGFILPPITEGITSEDNIEEIYDVTLEEIIKSKFNLIFFGDQESGKTTLLFRIVRYYVDEYSYLQKIPVYIDFASLGNKELITVIKEYLRCSSSDVTLLLEENKLVLIIDNLEFKKLLYVDQRNKILKLHKAYEGLHIIATAENLTVGIPPMDYIELCKIPFKNYFIKSLGAKEIKQLMRIWLPQESELSSDIRLERLVSSFSSYALPSTAMSVSLFLWSMEFSDRKPINHAVLMEIYIEILLQKLDKQNIYRETFDFTNKVQLLGKIAQEMLFKNESNYSILFSDFQSIVEKYLSEEVSFNFDATVIVNYLLERKIFVKYQLNRVKFTYSCFFHFFVAKRMVFSPTFKKHIIQEDQYFLHHKEIDYYTGLTRSDEEFLQLIVNRFEAKFKETDIIYENLDFDKFFTDQTVGKDKEHEPLAKSIEVDQLKENRPTTEMMESFYNERLSQMPKPGEIIKKEGKVTFQMLLIIMANVLRNSEGVENKALKIKAYGLQIKYSLTWMILYRESLIRYVVEHKILPPSLPKNINFHSFIHFFPLNVQSGMNNHLGSAKLSTIILEKIKGDLLSDSVSDLETFFSIALYSDVQGNEFDKYLKKFVKKLKKNVVRDYMLIKLVNYYYRRTRPNSLNENIYLDLISDLRIKTQKLPQKMKSIIMKSIQKSKLAFDDKQF